MAKPAAALACYDKAIGLAPADPRAHCGRGNALVELRQVDAAIASYDTAIRLRPDHADAWWNKSLALLLSGDLENGWPLYEWRWQRDSTRAHQRRFSQPRWLGTEPLQGKTILLHGEQGLGDTIQFCRYAGQVAGLGARVVLQVPAPLLALLNGLDGVSELVEDGKPLPPFDVHCSLMSLPWAMQTRRQTIPCRTAYLSADPLKLAQWAGRLGARAGAGSGSGNRPRVGIAWRGNAAHPNDRHRSLDLSTLLAHLPAHCDYVSLQKDISDADRATLARNPQVRHFGDQLADFSQTAALCCLMDRVVSVDTSVAHLSGALGVPTWLLLAHVPDWRWMLEGDDSPWYDAMTLWRQDAGRDWPAVLDRVAGGLSATL